MITAAQVFVAGWLAATFAFMAVWFSFRVAGPRFGWLSLWCSAACVAGFWLMLRAALGAVDRL